MADEISDETLGELIELIYDAALEPGSWASVLRRLRDVFDGSSALIAGIDFEQGDATIAESLEIESDVLDAWRTEHAQGDVWAAAGLEKFSREPGFATTGAELVPVGDLKKSSVYRDVLVRLGIEDTLSALTGLTSTSISYMGIYRSPSAGLYDRRERDLMTRLAPHIRRAMAIRGQLSLDRTVTASVLERHPVAVFVCDAEGRILQANSSGHELVGTRDGLHITSGQRLSAWQLEDRDALALAIRRAALSAPCDAFGRGSTLRVRRPSHRRPFGVHVAPAARERLVPFVDGSLHPALVFVSVSDPEAKSELIDEQVARLFGLTPAEARLAVALTRGQTTKDYSDEMGLSSETVRFHLKNTLRKTGARRQSELVTLLLTSVAILDSQGD